MNINIDEFIKIYDRVNIIDIRDSKLYNDGHIPAAVNINPYDLIEKPEKYLDSYKCYYIYCETGNGSIKVSTILNEKGYETFSIDGGFDAYLKWNLK